MTLQAHVDELASSGGGRIDLPPGDIALPSCGLLLDPSVSIVGSGPSTRLLYDGAGSALYRTAGGLTHSMLRLANFALECAPESRAGLDLRGTSNLGQVSVERLCVEGAKQGIVASHLYASSIAGCVVRHCRDGITLGAATICCQVSACWVRDFLRIALLVNGEATGPAQVVRVDDCIFDQPLPDDGQQGDYYATGLYTGYAHSVRVEGCHFEGLEQPAFLGGSPSRRNVFAFNSVRDGAIKIFHAARDTLVRANQLEGDASIVDNGTDTIFELQPEAV